MELYKYILKYPNGEVEDSQIDNNETFSSYEEAEEAALYAESCYKLGGEILHMSNPGDYDYNEDEEIEFEIEEIDE